MDERFRKAGRSIWKGQISSPAASKVELGAGLPCGGSVPNASPYHSFWFRNARLGLVPDEFRVAAAHQFPNDPCGYLLDGPPSCPAHKFAYFILVVLPVAVLDCVNLLSDPGA